MGNPPVFAGEIIIGLWGLILFFSLSSPLLTFTTLFQQKEWRWDRLNEHFRQRGFLNQAFGRVRPFLLAAFIAWELYAILNPLPSLKSTATYDAVAAQHIIRTMVMFGFIGLFALLSIVQIALRKQRKPVWTSKALLIFSGAAVLSLAAMFLSPLLIPFVIALQPMFVLLVWALLKPIDSRMKTKVMNSARDLRASWKDATVIGIAGSVGKTTTKELINHLLQDLKPMTTPAHVNTEMGVAQWLSRSSSRINELTNQRVVIVEMGAYRKGEIKLLCDIAQPTIGVMTALGSDHLALFGSEQAIIEANGELIEALPKDGHAFFYGENDGCTDLAKKAHCDVTLTTDLKLTKNEETKNGLRFELQAMGYEIALHGSHNIHNILLAIAVAKHLGIADKRISELLKSFKQTAHTFDVKTESGVLVLDDTYNISPLSFKAALHWAAEQKQRPRVLLTSGLQETGPEEHHFLKELGAQAKDSVERVVFTNKHGADIFATAFGKDVEILSSTTKKVDASSVLVCVGRMPLSTVTRLLP